METQLPRDYYGEVPAHGQHVEANPDDVVSTLSIVNAMYDCLSGPAGQSRDWNRMRSLSLAKSHSIRIGKLEDGTIGCKIMSNEDYILQMESWLVNNGFFEKEIHRVEERFGNIAQVFSTYESRRKADDAAPFMRGINSFQLMHDGLRWWIVNVMWQHESPDLPIPAHYLSR
jgi:hypothetical protein